MEIIVPLIIIGIIFIFLKGKEWLEKIDASSNEKITYEPSKSNIIVNSDVSLDEMEIISQVDETGNYCISSALTEQDQLILKEKNKELSPEEIAIGKRIESEGVVGSTLAKVEKFKHLVKEASQIFLLQELYSYNRSEAIELIGTAKSIEKKEKLKSIKRKIQQKAKEKYGDIPSDSREPIPEDIQNQVWNRDRGKCVKCGSKEKLEFDHIIPFSKGGSNTARNLQLLCEKCNREKSNNMG